jgi:dipeptidyl-peptidase-3
MKEDGKIKEEVYKIGGMYSKEIEKIVYYLEKAQEFAENDNQKAYTKELIKFYKTGDLTTWDKYNILWCQDNKSVCDYVNGFVETYNDPLGMKATWESVVDFKDKEATKRTETLCSNAQWFEDHSPINPIYRKKQVKGVSAKVINAVILAGDCYPTPPIGINLPNADWIRKEYGSKSVTIANLTDAYFFASLENPNSALNEFAFSEEEIKRAKTYGRLSENLHTDMHECLGHGSGQLLETTSSNALKEYSSTLEEARADLFALYYLMDKKLLELNLMPSIETGKAQYDSYIRNGLMVQLARIPLNEKITEAHMQDRALIANFALINGGCIKKETRQGKTYFTITDYEKLRECFGHLLFIIQDIKSRGDYNQGKELVEKYGVNIDKDLHKEIIERYNKLNLKPYGGFVNPDYTLVKDEKGDVIDVKYLILLRFWNKR